MHAWQGDGEARRIAGPELQYGLTFELSFRKRRRWSTSRGALVEVTADVLDLSVDGAMLRTSAAVMLDVGTQVTPTRVSGHASALVRHAIRVSAVSSSPWCFYNVQFRSPDPGFVRFVEDRLSDGRKLGLGHIA